MDAELTEKDLKLVDDDFKANMLIYESDCNKGKGNRGACHNVAEYINTVLQDCPRAAALYAANCDRNYAESCFSIATYYGNITDQHHCLG
jgi:hypothetical protein